MICSYFYHNAIYIMHQNIAGLINKTDLLIVKLYELSCKHISIDVVCITEHFIMAGQEEVLRLTNYKLAASYSRPEKRRGGSCILVKCSHHYKELPEIAKHSIPGIIECCAIELVMFKMVVVCVYRPPNYHNICSFYEKLDLILTNIDNRNLEKIIVTGDFNINILKNNTSSRELELILLNHNLKLEIKVPTRLASKTCIDNFAHNIWTGTTAEVLDLGLSDHTAQLLRIPVKKTCIIDYWFIRQRDYCNENLRKFKSYLESLTFSDVYETEDANIAYDNFLESFLMLYKLCFPWKKK